MNLSQNYSGGSFSSSSEGAFSDKDIEKWKIKNLIKLLDSYCGDGTSMISLFLPPKEQISKLSAKLTDEYGAASNIKSRVNRLSVLSAITSAQQKLKLYNRVPPNGLVIYCGSISTNTGKEKRINIDFEPFSPIRQNIYLCNDKFYTEPLQELLEDDKKYGFVIIDGHSCLFGLISGNNKEILNQFNVALPAKHNKGGQSALRFERLRKEKRNNYITKVLEECVKKFITNDKPNINGLFLAGLADFKLNLNEKLDQRLKDIIIKIVDISYGGKQGFNEAIDKCSKDLSDVALVKEKIIISQFMEKISGIEKRYCIGIDETILALDASAIETLIVWDELPIIRYRIIDKDGNEKIVFNNSNEILDRIIEQELFIDWIANYYKSFGTNLQLVSNRTPEGSQFCNGLGGLGGILRYNMDFDYLINEENENN